LEKYDTARQAEGDNMVHMLWMLNKKGYRHTLRICNTYCLSIVTMVTWLCWMLHHMYIAGPVLILCMS